MAKDFCFMFLPGDYLRDTQCLSEPVQVAYDRIMCEHMRNICISQQQLNFFTKKLNDDEKAELLSVLSKVAGGFQIDWVVDSIKKRRNYSDSRAKNRVGKKKNKEEDMKTYVPHMENEYEINNNSIKEGEDRGMGEEEGTPQTGNSEEVFIVPEMLAIFKAQNPGYVFQREKDFPALKKIAETIAEQEKIDLFTADGFSRVKETWTAFVAYLPTHRLYKQFAISQVEKYFQSIAMALTDSLKTGSADTPPAASEKKNTIQSNMEAADTARNFIANKYAQSG